MFVFISGYFNKVDQNTSLLEYAKRKTKTLLIPYFGISLIALLVEWLMECYKLGSISPYSVQRFALAMRKVLSTGEISGIAFLLWFVPTLFAVQIVYAFLKKMLHSHWNRVVAIVLFCMMNVLVVWYSKNIGTTRYTYHLLKVIFFLPFMELGIFYREVLEEKLEKKKHLFLPLILLLINMVRIMIMPDPYDIAYNNLSTMSGFTSPYPVTPLISSVIGILFWLNMVELFGPAVYENRTVNYISENAFFIMGFHMIFFNLLNCVLLAINKVYAFPGFSVTEFQSSVLYRWEYYSQFRFAYFAVGLLGSLALKQVYDRIRRREYGLQRKRLSEQERPTMLRARN